MASHDTESSLRAVSCVGERVDGRYFQWEFDTAHSGQIDRQPEQVGTAGQRWKGPREGEGKVEFVRGLLLLGEEHHGVFEREEDAWIHVKGEMKVQRAAASLLGMEVDFPDLTQGVRLDEVPLVVHMESVVNGVIF